jgi:hypothetical protein
MFNAYFIFFQQTTHTTMPNIENSSTLLILLILRIIIMYIECHYIIANTIWLVIPYCTPEDREYAFSSVK